LFQTTAQMKQINIFQAKANPELSVKDISDETRRVKIMLAHFDNVDSANDVIRKGAFAKSIKERGPESQNPRQIAFLRFHDFDKPIGKFLSLEETSEGLVAVAQLSNSTDGQNALEDYKAGIITQHSIGFQYVAGKIEQVDRDGLDFYNITELDLWEGSAVTFGVNPLTPTLDVAKGEHLDYLHKLNLKMNAIASEIRNGRGTDERFYKLEGALKVCQAQYNSLIKGYKPEKSTFTEEPIETISAPTLFQNILK